jgi:hypothetical protein
MLWCFDGSNRSLTEGEQQEQEQEQEHAGRRRDLALHG